MKKLTEVVEALEKSGETVLATAVVTGECYLWLLYVPKEYLAVRQARAIDRALEICGTDGSYGLPFHINAATPEKSNELVREYGKPCKMIKGKAYRDYAEHLRSSEIQAQVKATIDPTYSTMRHRIWSIRDGVNVTIAFPNCLKAADIEQVRKYLGLLEQELRLAERVL